MIRLGIGALLMLIMCYIGMGIERFYRKKVEIMQDFISFLSYASREINFLKTDMLTLISKYIKDKKTPFTSMLANIKSDMEKGKETVNADNPYLSVEEKRLIKGFFEGIAKSDFHEQGKIFARYNGEGNDALKKAEKQKKERGELAKKLFILGGVGLLIVII